MLWTDRWSGRAALRITRAASMKVTAAAPGPFASEVKFGVPILSWWLLPEGDFIDALNAWLSDVRAPSSDIAQLMLRVINSTDALRKKAVEYRNLRVMTALSDRACVPVDDPRLELAATLFNVTVVTACANLVVDVDAALLGPRVVSQCIDTAFAQLSELAAELQPGKVVQAGGRVADARGPFDH